MSETTEQTASKSKPKKLTDVAIRHAKAADRFAREDGLQLRVEPDGAKRWLFKYKFQGKENVSVLWYLPDRITVGCA